MESACPPQRVYASFLQAPCIREPLRHGPSALTKVSEKMSRRAAPNSNVTDHKFIAPMHFVKHGWVQVRLSIIESQYKLPKFVKKNLQHVPNIPPPVSDSLEPFRGFRGSRSSWPCKCGAQYYRYLPWTNVYSRRTTLPLLPQMRGTQQGRHLEHWKSHP